eukprot:Gregarina_sp_Poly_1__2857@NODE_1799_length_3305_cov_756_496603_g1169_i0_p1_GENE_NODE_1799_length_3305_cov_756_496603_g1169_i0NODE_1799_length_3305_cov_756_496603_g1169_i0_p1_ORF_typecomplete_len778_score100_50GCS/PF03074_16/7_5e127GCS2/PF04107_13/11GCS2/PF04107_13/0_18S1/PF00575_23/0_13_NODE_1799_length_3305_cov_756_496603_g1169_i09143247
MGFLEIGVPFSWEDSKSSLSRVKRDGIKQLIHVWQINRHREDLELKWGDEVEYQLVRLDHQNREAKLCIDGPAFLEELMLRERNNDWPDKEMLGRAAMFVSGASSVHLRGSEWHPEFGRHMIEATPNPPYDLGVNSLLDVEDSLISRRYKLQSILPQNVFAVSMTAFPHLGVGSFTWSHEDEKGRDARLSGGSLFIPREFICPHPRFGCLVANVNARRGVKVAQLVPLFQDHHTPDSPIWKSSLPENTTDRRKIVARAQETPNPVAGHIFMDHFGFGMGQCCLQVTFGCPNLNAARTLYDQMAVLAPIFLALSAGTPALRGLLADTDTRWRVLEQGCDCRSEDELNLLKQSRYGVVPMYIGNSQYLKEHISELNDIDVPINKEAYEQLKAAKMDDILATHFAHLWVRDPLVIFRDRLDLDNNTHVDHFENIQSTNWNSVRFKPPPVSLDGKTRPKIGWRVELRTPDLQISDFENAVLCCFAQLLCLAILREGWRFYIPISQVLANMNAAHRRDAAVKERFYFRRDLSTLEGEDGVTSELSSLVFRMTLREIFLGSNRTLFEGLIPMLDKFVSNEWRNQRCSRNAVEKYRIYANYIRQKVLGQAWSDAKVIRHMVRSSPLYDGDSIISPEMNYELCKFAVMAGFGLCQEVSPWALPGCLPSRRVSSHLPLSALSSTSTLASIAQIPINGSETLADKIIGNASSESMTSTRSDEESIGLPSTCREAWDPVATLPTASLVVDPIRRPEQLVFQSQPLTPSGLTLQDFDPDLFLEMDKHSR